MYMYIHTLLVIIGETLYFTCTLPPKAVPNYGVWGATAPSQRKWIQSIMKNIICS